MGKEVYVFIALVIGEVETDKISKFKRVVGKVVRDVEVLDTEYTIDFKELLDVDITFRCYRVGDLSVHEFRLEELNNLYIRNITTEGTLIRFLGLVKGIVYPMEFEGKSIFKDEETLNIFIGKNGDLGELYISDYKGNISMVSVRDFTGARYCENILGVCNLDNEKDIEMRPWKVDRKIEKVHNKCVMIPNMYPYYMNEVGGVVFNDEYGDDIGTIEFNSNVKYVCEEGFKGNLYIEKLVFNEGCLYVDKGAFEGCTNLMEVDFGNSIRRIGDRAFIGCKNLEIVKLPRDLESLGVKAFSRCNKLKKLLVPKEVLVRLGERNIYSSLDISKYASIKIV